MSSASRQPHNFTHTQPKTYRLSFKAFISFPLRLCNPPPAIGKVRSCGVTPLFNVRLEDVLDRKHLPPLGLKDFEEWLLFVELSAENLYFTLWLREYKQRYDQWKSQAAFQKGHSPHDFPPDWSLQYSSQLAMFYARAKQTFFTPGSEYELNLSSRLLAPFHQPDMPPYPHPDLFDAVAAEIYQTLQESLRRFVHAQFNNAGNNRVLCGIIVGLFCSLLGFVPPTAVSIARGASRWTRLSALPGLWIGLTILIASLNGICLGVYIFGDLRQLRKFELSRPSISKPQPLPAFKRPSISSRPLSTNSMLPIQHLSRKPTISHSNHDHNLHDTHRLKRECSISSNKTHISGTSSDDCNIQISPAYYDGDVADGPTTYHPDSDYQFPPNGMASGNSSPGSSFTATASFILPFGLTDDEEEYDTERQDRSDRLRPYPPFDFDSLPRKPNYKATTTVPRLRLPHHDDHTPVTPPPAVFSPTTFVPHFPPEANSPRGFLERMQEKCIRKLPLQRVLLESEDSISKKTKSEKWYQQPSMALSSPDLENPGSTTASGSSWARLPKDKDGDESQDVETKVRKRFRFINAVPAFAAPFTRVLNPVIVRGQWEIVVNSAIIAFLVSWVVVGSFLALPVWDKDS